MYPIKRKTLMILTAAALLLISCSAIFGRQTAMSEQEFQSSVD